MASYTTDASGRVIMTGTAPLVIPSTQNIQGGIIEAAGAKTIASQAAAAAHYAGMGAGQKGSGRRTRRRKLKRGGAVQNLNVAPSQLPTANSVPGINHEDILKNAADLQNQIKANSGYDHLRSATPIKMGGFRLRGAEELYPGSGSEEDTKGRRKVNGRRRKRTHRRKRGKSTHRRSRKRRNL